VLVRVNSWIVPVRWGKTKAIHEITRSDAKILPRVLSFWDGPPQQRHREHEGYTEKASHARYCEVLLIP